MQESGGTDLFKNIQCQEQTSYQQTQKNAKNFKANFLNGLAITYITSIETYFYGKLNVVDFIESQFTFTRILSAFGQENVAYPMPNGFINCLK